jgi:hypothetical protein
METATSGPLLAQIVEFDESVQRNVATLEFDGQTYRVKVSDKTPNLQVLVEGPKDPYGCQQVGYLIRMLRSKIPIVPTHEDSEEEIPDFLTEKAELKKRWLVDIVRLEQWLAEKIRQQIVSTDAAEYL